MTKSERYLAVVKSFQNQTSGSVSVNRVVLIGSEFLYQVKIPRGLKNRDVVLMYK